MNPKVKALVWTGGLLIVTLLCAYVSWSKAVDQEGVLQLTLRVIAVLFFLTSLVAGGCLVWFVRASEETLAKPQPRPATNAAPTNGQASGDTISFAGLEETAAPSKQPRVAKKTPRPAAQSVPANLPTAGKQPRPAKKAPRDE